jgi:hypothetical protein
MIRCSSRLALAPTHTTIRSRGSFMFPCIVLASIALLFNSALRSSAWAISDCHGLVSFKSIRPLSVGGYDGIIVTPPPRCPWRRGLSSGNELDAAPRARFISSATRAASLSFGSHTTTVLVQEYLPKLVNVAAVGLNRLGMIGISYPIGSFGPMTSQTSFVGKFLILYSLILNPDNSRRAFRRWSDAGGAEDNPRTTFTPYNGCGRSNSALGSLGV